MIRLTREQVREIDRRAIEEYHIPGIVLMENAARSAADVACEMLGHKSAVVIFCGGGNNGGDGLAIARHLHNRGARVVVEFVGDERKLRGDARINFEITRKMGLIQDAEARRHVQFMENHRFGAHTHSDLVIDAVYGTGLSTPPRSPFENIVAEIEYIAAPVLAIDVPSGLDCDTGKPVGKDCVRATRTVTFVTEKLGFANPDARQYTGEITIGDIGCPRKLIEEIFVSTR